MLRLQCFQQGTLSLLSLHFLLIGIFLGDNILGQHHSLFGRNMRCCLTIEIHGLLKILQHKTRVDASPLFGWIAQETIGHYIHLLLLIRSQFVLPNLRVLESASCFICKVAAHWVLISIFVAWRFNYSVQASLPFLLWREFGIPWRILLVYELIRDESVKFAISHLLISMNSVEILFLQFFMHVIYSLICGQRMLLNSSSNPLQFFRLWELDFTIFISLL